MGRSRGPSALCRDEVRTPLDRRTATAVAVGTLAVSNVLTNRVLPDAGYVPWNLALAVGLLGLARRTGIDRDAVGVGPDGAARSVAIGTVGAAGVAAGWALAVRADARGALRDERATRLSPARARYEVLVRIPLGTVVAEEVAFRGVLPALLAGPGRTGRGADGAASLLFGLWHLLPSRDLAVANDGAGRVADRVGSTGTALLAVGTTTVAGLVLAALRRHSGHLAAPLLLHWAANAVGLVAARRVARRG